MLADDAGVAAPLPSGPARRPEGPGCRACRRFVPGWTVPTPRRRHRRMAAAVPGATARCPICRPARSTSRWPSARRWGSWLRAGWPAGAKDRYAALSDAVARASARRWEEAIDSGGGAGEAMLWRLLRIGSAPYFVLGSAAERSLRLRIATSWDWRQQFKLVALTMEGQAGGQPRVGWEAVVRERTSRAIHPVVGHIEVRWSHGRFGGLPEAKGYLDMPHHLVPGYFPLR